ncbi:MAG TPA: hypothetical protein VGM67_13460 [Gemmatimonadaceae bacterium]|jgi:hypothetical protein
MADQHSDKMGDKASRPDNSDRSENDEAMHERDKGGEWLRDQVGEDHNLSGSSTFRTLPDQPGTGSKSKDKKEQDDRQSNR